MTRHALILSSLLAAAAPLAAAPAHEHGAVRLDVAIEGQVLAIAVEAPLDSLLGFERAPRNERERGAADAMLARWRSGAGLFGADAAAQCTLTQADVHAPVLEPGARPAGDAHADLDASIEFRCLQPQQLRTLDVGLFDAFARIQRIDVQVAGPGGQHKTTLERPARSVPLAR